MYTCAALFVPVYEIIISVCRYADRQALNWLLRSVTQPTCLHDLMWHLSQALSPDTAHTGSGPQVSLPANPPLLRIRTAHWMASLAGPGGGCRGECVAVSGISRWPCGW